MNQSLLVFESTTWGNQAFKKGAIRQALHVCKSSQECTLKSAYMSMYIPMCLQSKYSKNGVSLASSVGWLFFSHVKYITVRCATIFIFVQKDFQTAACGETWLFLSTWQAEARQSLSLKPVWSTEPVPGQAELCREIVSKNHKRKRLAGCGSAYQ